MQSFALEYSARCTCILQAPTCYKQSDAIVMIEQVPADCAGFCVFLECVHNTLSSGQILLALTEVSASGHVQGRGDGWDWDLVVNMGCRQRFG